MCSSSAAPAIENRSTEVLDSVATVDAESITEGGANQVDERRPLLGRKSTITTAAATPTAKSTTNKIKIKLSNHKKNKNIQIPKSVYQQQLSIL